MEGKRYRVLMAIATDADDAGVVEDLTVGRLARRIQAGERTVYYALRDLQRLGALEVKTVPGRGSRYRVLRPVVTPAITPATTPAKPQVGKVVQGDDTPAIVAGVHREEASSTELPSTTTTVVPVPPGGAGPSAAGGGGRSIDQTPTSPRPVSDTPSLDASAGRGHPDPLGPVLERLSPDAQLALRAIVDRAWDNPDVHPVVALLAATAYERVEAPGASPEQVSAAITRRASAGRRRVERPRPHAAPAAPRGRAPSAPHPAGRRPPGRSAGGRARRDPHVRPAVPPPPAIAPGPIPQLELERMALQWAPAHGAPADVADQLAAEAARVAWLKAQQGNCGNVLLYLDGVVKRRAREARQRAERAAAQAAAPQLCQHRNDPADCGQCNWRPAQGGPIPAHVQAELEAARRAAGLRPGRAPPAEAS